MATATRHPVQWLEQLQQQASTAAWMVILGPLPTGEEDDWIAAAGRTGVPVLVIEPLAEPLTLPPSGLGTVGLPDGGAGSETAGVGRLGGGLDWAKAGAAVIASTASAREVIFMVVSPESWWRHRLGEDDASADWKGQAKR